MKSNAQGSLRPGCATAAGTMRYARRFMTGGEARVARGHFRERHGIWIASLGIGTYLGEPDEATDEGYTAAIVLAVESGTNVIDTASNYRFQRSERSVSAAITKLLSKGYQREELAICTKAGFLTPDGAMPADASEYFNRTFVAPGILRPEDVAAGCHAMSPAYLEDQLARSKRNMGLECVDVFYIHNPETQLGEVARLEFMERIARAFEWLESAVKEGSIRNYGMATWNGFRQAEDAQDYLSLEEIEALARKAGGEEHHFRFVQLPFNLAMPEALLRINQRAAGKSVSMTQAASALGITVVASASLLQGQLARKLPAAVSAALGLDSDELCALQFARSAPGIATALVGMRHTEHVRRNLSLAEIPPASREEIMRVFARPSPAR
jgi:aryl-alcohol dehydrogenase-like predicted oxidoreductase